MMEKFYIGTNWKMTKTLAEGLEYTRELRKISDQLDPSKIELFIIPSYTSLIPIKSEVENSHIRIGAQNMHWEERGAYTGEISPLMLKEIGIDIIELGHSERRQYFNENDEDINKKAHAALSFNMKPLICIGERLDEKENDISVETLAKQIKICLKDVKKEQLSNILLAYEPVWAIGEKGIPADADYVSYIHREIRSILVELFEEEGNQVPILFGGSVNLDNYLDYFKDENVNGLFIGRAAWNTESFETILNKCNSLL
jgi:L-erythrulose 1-phosphate isomerase